MALWPWGKKKENEVVGNDRNAQNEVSKAAAKRRKAVVRKKKVGKIIESLADVLEGVGTEKRAAIEERIRGILLK